MAGFFSNIEQIQYLREVFSTLKSDDLWFKSVDKDVMDMIIQMNTEDQLEEQGIDSLGRALGEYSPFTIAEKRMKGDRYDHITLKDTGAFYDSWIVWVDTTGINLDADDTSRYDEPLFEVWGVDVLGLTEDNMIILQEVIAENYINLIMERL